MDGGLERRWSLALVAASVVAFLGLFLVLPSSFQTPDEAKYVGVGLNILEGHGPVTDFGVQFILHPPLWPIVLALPRQLVGVDPLLIGHLLDAAFGAALILLCARLAWAIRPAAGALTAIALLAAPYLGTLARTAGIDLPAAAFSLAYLLVAYRAIDTGSTRLGLVAGVLFGVAFLTKETVIPFAPMPFLVAFTSDRPFSRVARVGAAALLTATFACAPWFAYYAGQTGSVYRLGGPSWLLVPIAIVVLVVIAAGLWAPAIGARLAASRGAWIQPDTARRARLALAVGGILVWLGVQLWTYAGAAKLAGSSLIRPSQLLDDARVYLPQIGLIVGYGVVGTLLAIRACWSDERVRQLFVAAIAQGPLILLVLGIGETPRHYIATIGLLAALGSVGWIEACGRAVAAGQGRRASVDRALLVAGAVVVLGIRAFGVERATLATSPVVAVAVVVALVLATSRIGQDRGGRLQLPGIGPATSIAAGLVAAFVLALGIAGSTVARTGNTATVGSAESKAVATVGEWARTALPADATIVVGPDLGYDLALATHGVHRTVRIQPISAAIDVKAPDGLRLPGGADISDIVSLEATLHVVDRVDVYRASDIANRLTSLTDPVWIEAQTVPTGVAQAAVLAAFDATRGMTRIASWQFPYADHVLLVSAYRVDLAALKFAPRSIQADAPGILNLARTLSGRPESAGAATRLLAVLVPASPGPEADAALAALKRVAAGQPAAG